MRKSFIAGNWKMFKNVQEAVELAQTLVDNNKNISDRDIMIAPTFVCLSEVNKIIKDSNISLSAQNMHFEASGAFTGEISADMLNSVGCKYVILGHSERRWVFNETDEMINKKVKAAIEAGITPILCVGEKLDERENGTMNQVVKAQLEKGYANLNESDAEKVIVAYEPVWAIGTGKTATPEDADDMHANIRTSLSELYSDNLSQQARILYGGSVKDTNVDSIMGKENIDGVLVGGAALNPETFTRIINFQ